MFMGVEGKTLSWKHKSTLVDDKVLVFPTRLRLFKNVWEKKVFHVRFTWQPIWNSNGLGLIRLILNTVINFNGHLLSKQWFPLSTIQRAFLVLSVDISIEKDDRRMVISSPNHELFWINLSIQITLFPASILFFFVKFSKLTPFSEQSQSNVNTV